ncbi:MAG TPA: rhomboid family intramembrane serine protease [Phycisphaerae bacterium]|nr:rhomboid family intramembrane serine protease [Phycisphaerae bacterium]
MIIPLRVDVPTWRRPFVNWVLMAVIICMSIAAFYDVGLLYDMAGVEGGGLTQNAGLWPVYAVSSSFLHGGWVHLIGNMLFLWIFGNAVNYKFGHLGYAGLYLAAAMVGGLAHYGLDGRPAVGASGAINGVMGAFLVFFPRNNISCLFLMYFPPYYFIARRFTLSSIWMILFWIAWDLFYLAMGTQTCVGHWAHAGGFLAGFGVAILCAISGLVKPTEDEQTLLQVLKLRR